MLFRVRKEQKSQDCLLRPEVDMGAVLESELGQQWR